MMKTDGNTIQININLDTNKPVTMQQSAQLTLIAMPQLPWDDITKMVDAANAMVDEFVSDDPDLMEIMKFVMFHEQVVSKAKVKLHEKRLKVSVETNQDRVDGWTEARKTVAKREKNAQISKTLKAWSHDALKMVHAWMEVTKIPGTKSEIKEVTKFLDALKVLYLGEDLNYDTLSRIYNKATSNRYDMAIVRAHLKLKELPK